MQSVTSPSQNSGFAAPQHRYGVIKKTGNFLTMYNAEDFQATGVCKLDLEPAFFDACQDLYDYITTTKPLKSNILSGRGRRLLSAHENDEMAIKCLQMSPTLKDFLMNLMNKPALAMVKTVTVSKNARRQTLHSDHSEPINTLYGIIVSLDEKCLVNTLFMPGSHVTYNDDVKSRYIVVTQENLHSIPQARCVFFDEKILHCGSASGKHVDSLNRRVFFTFCNADINMRLYAKVCNQKATVAKYRPIAAIYKP